ncbi:MAG: bifunctional 5,10-methylenetetrahydrofolate dehydrogenase/5,10-methenyltetrahydrofolate cyclohydrolase [Lachnospiraceae bacterium]|nr:bifunctional 5,10-methylenetetrahydrofolate dehydrogenase/5,10-methenyltetrahydrofolate cyclohydrolase [Lachnospiraceae bacterium]
MAKLLLAKEVNAALCERTRERAAALRGRGITPTLAIVRVGEREDDLYYERGAVKRCSDNGIEVRRLTFDADVTTERMIDAVRSLNDDDGVHGVLILRPLPSGIDEKAVCEALDPCKDVDGITSVSASALYQGSGAGFAPCTACSVMEILRHYGIDLRGRKAVVIGRSLVIGKPVAMMLLAENATVTICHSKSRDLQEICRGADILIASAGRARMVTAEYLSAGQTVIDVGINVGEDGKMCGDVDGAAAEGLVGAYTPVPGGVGGVTTSILAAHVAEAAERMAGFGRV